MLKLVISDSKELTEKYLEESHKKVEAKIQQNWESIVEETRLNLKNFKINLMKDLLGHDTPE